MARVDYYMSLDISLSQTIYLCHILLLFKNNILLYIILETFLLHIFRFFFDLKFEFSHFFNKHLISQ